MHRLLKVVALVFLVAVILAITPSISKQPRIDLSASDKKEIMTLLRNNDFSTKNLLPYGIDHSPYGKTYIRAYQVYKGIALDEDVILIFSSSSGIFYSINGSPVSNISISNNPSVSNAQLVLKNKDGNMEEYTHYVNIARPIELSIKPEVSVFDAILAARSNSLFFEPWFANILFKFSMSARLSIFDSSRGLGPQSWKLAWIITPKWGDYPKIVFDANTAEVLTSYDMRIVD